MVVAPKRLRIRSRVVLARDVSLAPYALLKKGERGSVVAVEDDTGGTWQAEVRMDKHHPGLALWGNEALLAEPDVSAITAVSRVKSETLALTCLVVVVVLALSSIVLHVHSLL